MSLSAHGGLFRRLSHRPRNTPRSHSLHALPTLRKRTGTPFFWLSSQRNTGRPCLPPKRSWTAAKRSPCRMPRRHIRKTALDKLLSDNDGIKLILASLPFTESVRYNTERTETCQAKNHEEGARNSGASSSRSEPRTRHAGIGNFDPGISRF